MSKGFLKRAKQEIYAHPGQSGQTIARKLLKSGEVESRAQNPEMSLVATLTKHYEDIEVKRRKVDGLYRYYPNTYSFPFNNSLSGEAATVETLGDEAAEATSSNGGLRRQGEATEGPSDKIVITGVGVEGHCRFAQALVETGRCKSLDEAFALMLSQGREAIKRSLSQM